MLRPSALHQLVMSLPMTWLWGDCTRDQRRRVMFLPPFLGSLRMPSPSVSL